MGGGDILAKNLAKEEIEKFCTSKLRTTEEEKENMLKKAMAGIENESSVSPNKYVEIISEAI